jgi:glutamine amidotransferase
VEKQRDKILSTLPPFLARNVQGETDSELAFHLFLDVLFKEGKLNDLGLGAEHLAGYLKTCVAEIDELQGNSQKKQELAIIVTNGQVMAAVARGVTMHYSHREGILECARHNSSEQQKQIHGRFRGIMLGIEMTDPGHQWRELTDRSLLSISKELELKVQQL